MAFIIKAITDKKDWAEKINNPSIQEKWIDELLKQGVSRDVAVMAIRVLSDRSRQPRMDLENNYDLRYPWCLNLNIKFDVDCKCRCHVCEGDNYIDSESDCENLEQLYDLQDGRRYQCVCQLTLPMRKANYLASLSIIRPELINSEIRQRLVDATVDLEQRKDWHPGTNNRVLNLIHPSLPCYVDRVTRLVKSDKDADKLPVQCLICNEISTKVVNLQCGKTMCEDCLIQLKHPKCPFCRNSHDIAKLQVTLKHQQQPPILQWLPADFNVTHTESHDEDSRDDLDTLPRETQVRVEFTSHINALQQREGVNGPIHTVLAYILAKMVPEFEKVLKLIHVREIGQFSCVKPYPWGGAKTCLDKGQVIVKMSNVQLTPDNPTFEGTNWHLEGVPEENIVATGIYYYDVDNVEDATLDFRMTINHRDVDYRQGAWSSVDVHYGLEGDPDDCQLRSTKFGLGSITTKPGMCLFFANCLQHRLNRVELRDPTRPGHRKILVFFLVHPDHPIKSTRDIQPDQSHISRPDAELYRELLMFSRSHEINRQAAFYKREISLCEH